MRGFVPFYLRAITLFILAAAPVPTVAAADAPPPPASTSSGATPPPATPEPGAGEPALSTEVYDLRFRPRAGTLLRYSVVDKQATERRVGSEATKRTLVNDLTIRLKVRRITSELAQVELSFDRIATTLIRDGKKIEYSSEKPEQCPYASLVTTGQGILKRVFVLHVSEHRTVELLEGADDLLTDDLAAECFAPVASKSSLRDLAGAFFTPGDRAPSGARIGQTWSLTDTFPAPDALGDFDAEQTRTLTRLEDGLARIDCVHSGVLHARPHLDARVRITDAGVASYELWDFAAGLLDTAVQSLIRSFVYKNDGKDIVVTTWLERSYKPAGGDN